MLNYRPQNFQCEGWFCGLLMPAWCRREENQDQFCTRHADRSSQIMLTTPSIKSYFVFKRRCQMSIKSVKQIPHRTYNAGEIIYSVDEQSRNVFLIHSGQVAIETRLGLNVGILNEGEIFGEVGHITAKPRTVTARAKTKCIVKVIDEDTLKAKMQGADPICLAIIRGLSMRISDANAKAEQYWKELSLYKALEADVSED